MEDLIKDFEKEVNIIKFPYSDLIYNNDHYKKVLFEQFKELKPVPKDYLYIQDFLSIEDLHKELYANKPPTKTNQGTNYVMADFYGTGKLESLADDLATKFYYLDKKTLDKKYFGRLIKETDLFKQMQDIDNVIQLFDKYVITDTNKGNYQNFAKASTDKVIRLLDQTGLPGLKTDILNMFIDRSNDESISLTVLFALDRHSNQSQLEECYSTLKVYADALINTELSKPQVKPKEVKQSREVFNTLADAAKSKEAEQEIYRILKDAQLIDQDSNVVIDKTASNKGFFYSTMILFYEKGYFKRKPEIDEFIAICQNTFNITISKGTGKNHKNRPSGLTTIPAF